MADRYWVGGSGTWNTTSTTNWSAASGGAGGASVPTTADNVFFDQAGTYTVTCTGALTCLDITVSAGTVTFASGTSPTLAISGSMSLIAGTVWSLTGAISFNSTTTGRTVTTNGVAINGSMTFNGVGGGWTLGSALTCSTTFTVTAGAFNTSINNYSLTVGSLATSGISTKSISLNGSTVTLTASVTNSISFNATGLTFDAGTSQIILSATNGNILSTGYTFYNVAFTNLSPSSTKLVTGINVFNNFSVAAPSVAGVITITFDSPQTINGTLSTTGTAGNRRVWFRGATYGIAQTLTVNSAPSLADADFRDIYVVGTAAPITGTRIGDQRGCRGITFSAPKTVYWNLAGTQFWTSNAWATTPFGSPSVDNFPLPQDTAAFTDSGAAGNVQMISTVPYAGSVDMSARTSALTFTFGAAQTVYGDWKSGPGVTYSGTQIVTFSGRNTQTITSAGKTFSCPIVIDSYGGTVQLADALNITGGSALTVNNGTFDTKSYALTAGSIQSSNSSVRAIKLGSSAVSIYSGTINASISTNLTVDAGTSTVTISSGGALGLPLNGLTFYNVVFTAGTTLQINNACTFNNLTLPAPSSAGVVNVVMFANVVVNGTLTVAGASSVRRLFVYSDTLGTQRTLTVNSLSASDCDFRDIAITGAAAGTAPTRAGDCGGNSGITFPAAKTVYWNLAGSQNWSATGWAATSGGTPNVNNFPLAQDTAVFDDTGAAGSIAMDSPWNIGTVNASARTAAMPFTISVASAFVYGSWTSGIGLTFSGAASINFQKNGTQTITSAGVPFSCSITINHPRGSVQLADALSVASSSVLSIQLGATFDAGTYNVTTGYLSGGTSTVKMGSGTWTITGSGSLGVVWSVSSSTAFDPGSSNIVLSDSGTTQKTFGGAGLYYNKLTIGGGSSTSTVAITGNNTFGEIASTRTSAYTISLGAVMAFGKWSVTGSAGNVVTLTGGVTSHLLAGPATSGIDFLDMGTVGFAATSPGEFYAGANSTGTAVAPVFRVATPTPRTLYWVGGTGNWSSTARWSLSSGGAGGEQVPTSLDNVIFDSASNATAYTVTIGSTSRCNNFTMSGPASGDVTFAGTGEFICHGSMTFAASGITRTYNGNITLSGVGTGKTFSTNGLSLSSSSITVNGVGSNWALGSALTSIFIIVTRGSFDFAGYNATISTLSSDNNNKRSISMGASTVTCSGNSILFGTTTSAATALTFDAGTSQINHSSASSNFQGNGKTFYNTSFTSNTNGTIAIDGANTFNNLSFSSKTNGFFGTVTFSANQTINNALTLSPSSDARYRTFFLSSVIGTQRTMTVNSFAAGAADYDFRDIVIAGAAAPISGTRFGDCKGNSGIAFDAPKTVYWNFLTGNLWSSTSWATTAGGTPSLINFPLAQDTVIISATGLNSGSTITVNVNYNIGTIDMSARTTNTMTLATGTTAPTIYGNWINGSGVTLTGTNALTFAGRTAQTITSAGRTFTQGLTINSLGGSVTLQDAYTISGAFNHQAGTFDASTYNFTSTNTSSLAVQSPGALTRTLALGSGTWTSAATGSPAFSIVATGITVTGTGTIRLTSASAKTFAGNGISFSGITLDNAGAGTLTISGDNTFKDITNTYSSTGAANITFTAGTTQRISRWSAKGTIGKALTVQSSSTTPATLIFVGSGSTATTYIDYLSIYNVRSYSPDNTWYAGPNSTNLGSLGWYFEYGPTTSQLYYGDINIQSITYGTTPVSEIYFGSTKVF